jgi:hypothetical protein
LISFVLLSLLSQFHLWKYQLHNLEHFQITWKTSKWPRWASRHFDTTSSISLQRNSARSMCTICFPKPVSCRTCFANWFDSSTIMDWGSVRSRQRSLLLHFPAQIETSVRLSAGKFRIG